MIIKMTGRKIDKVDTRKYYMDGDEVDKQVAGLFVAVATMQGRLIRSYEEDGASYWEIRVG